MDIITRYFSDFTNTQLTQFGQLDEVYRDWNEKINVISRKDIDALYEKHILHSLAIAAMFPFEKGMEILDLGTGGGFPGIPLAIFFPDTKFLLADSIGKKLKVIEAVVGKSGLKNVETRHTRAESIRDRQFDFVVSRAVAPLGDLWKWSKPLLKKEHAMPFDHVPGLICLKGGDLAKEIQESRTRPRVMEVSDIFDEPYFKEKFLLFVPR